MDQAQQLRDLVKQHNTHQSTARVITVTSGKGGVGKTNVSVNLALQIQKLGKKVLILDADFGLANIEVMLGIVPSYSLADLMFRGKDIQDIITKGPLDIDFISGGSGIQELTSLTKEQIFYLINKLNQLDQIADVIIIDTGAGISDSVMEFVLASSEILLVTTPEPTSITDSYALLKALNRNKSFSKENTNIKLIANRATTEKEGTDIFAKLNLVSHKFLDITLNHIGTVPHDLNIQRAVMEQKPISLLYPNSDATKAFETIALTLMDFEINKSNKKGISQFFSNLIKIKLFK